MTIFENRTISLQTSFQYKPIIISYLFSKGEFVNKKPHTMLSLSDEGRKAFQDYRESMKRVLDDLPK